MSTYLDSITEKAKTEPIEAGVELTRGLMRWSTSGRLGYSLGSALISASEMLSLTTSQTAAVADRVVNPLLHAAVALLAQRDKSVRLTDDIRDPLVDFGENPFTM